MSQKERTKAVIIGKDAFIETEKGSDACFCAYLEKEEQVDVLEHMMSVDRYTALLAKGEQPYKGEGAHPVYCEERESAIRVLRQNLGLLLNANPEANAVYCLLENNEIREQFLKWAREWERPMKTPNYIHPEAKVNVELIPDAGTYVFDGSTIETNVRLKESSIIEEGVYVSECSTLGRFVFLSKGVKLDKNVTVGDFVFVGANTTICEGAIIKARIKIGKACTVLKGSVVTEDVPDGAVVSGNPAKIVKS